MNELGRINAAASPHRRSYIHISRSGTHSAHQRMASVANMRDYPKAMVIEVNGVSVWTLTILQVSSMTCFKLEFQKKMQYSEIVSKVSRFSPRSLMHCLRWIMALTYRNRCVHSIMHSIIQLLKGSCGLLWRHRCPSTIQVRMCDKNRSSRVGKKGTH